MRYAIISDIHSNQEALEAVLKKITSVKADKILCLGDVVGYNADPAACVEKVRGSAGAIVRGNHDKAVVGLMKVDYFNSHAAEAVRWTERALAPEALDYLRQLPQGPVGCEGGIVLCHGSPQDEDLYLTSHEAVEDGFEFLKDAHPGARVCFFGHTHVPLAIDNEGNLFNTEGAVYLEKDRVYLINPGSVGQPRDNNPAAGFGLYDDEDSVFTFYRVTYPVKETQEKILQAGLPAVLAQRLKVGR